MTAGSTPAQALRDTLDLAAGGVVVMSIVHHHAARPSSHELIAGAFAPRLRLLPA